MKKGLSTTSASPGLFDYLEVVEKGPHSVRKLSPACRPGVAPNRFGNQEIEEIAATVRAVLADRVEQVFGTGMSELALVLKAVDVCGKIVQAVDCGSLEDAQEHIAALRKHAVVMHEHGVQLSMAGLLKAVQVALFPEEYLPSDDVDERIAQHYQKAAELRRQRIKFVEEARKRFAADQQAQEREDYVEGEMKAWVKEQNRGKPKDDWMPGEGREAATLMGGIVPAGGGERLGEYRLRMFAKWLEDACA